MTINPAKPPEGILFPSHPWDPADRIRSQTWERFRAKMTGDKTSDGGSFTTYIRLSGADADRVIENIKAYGLYPNLNTGGKYGGAENAEKYWEWIREEFLEKPFRAKVDAKIEEAAIESRMKEIEAARQKSKEDQKKETAKSFISGGGTSFRSGKKINAKTTSISNIIPKKTIPQEIVEKITSPSELGGGENEPVTNAPRGVVTSLGRLTLNLEQSNNNLEKIIEVIVEDYKT
ncbi:MAG: hypothetical protein EBS19_13740, partial [Spirochaetia bacterium]|nr:hypothetical protein [Spirochaetia bacterium]